MQKLAITALLLLIGCSPTGPVRVTGEVLRDDLSQITDIVQKELASRNRSGRIKTMSETNGTAEVWYADMQARWGEAGFTLERQTNHWKITTVLFR